MSGRRAPACSPPSGSPAASISRSRRMQTVRSADGTAIAFDRSGAGPALILVVGALQDRAATRALAAALAPHFTVYSYDRRGRGSSGDTAPHSVDREIEELGALVAEAGGSAFAFGHSSGAMLALEAAARGLAVTKLAVYEPPDRKSTRLNSSHRCISY